MAGVFFFNQFFVVVVDTNKIYSSETPSTYEIEIQHHKLHTYKSITQMFASYGDNNFGHLNQ